MKLSDFEIGQEFRCGEGVWRCTDVGSRVVVAIQINRVKLTSFDSKTRETTEQVTLQTEAEEQGLFNGPPYLVMEYVFDEDSMEACEMTP